MVVELGEQVQRVEVVEQGQDQIHIQRVEVVGQVVKAIGLEAHQVSLLFIHPLSLLHQLRYKLPEQMEL